MKTAIGFADEEFEASLAGLRAAVLVEQRAALEERSAAAAERAAAHAAVLDWICAWIDSGFDGGPARLGSGEPQREKVSAEILRDLCHEARKLDADTLAGWTSIHELAVWVPQGLKAGMRMRFDRALEDLRRRGQNP